MTKIDQIKHAIHEANLFRSRLTPEALAVPGFTSLKIRHLMNNLGAISSNFMEVGSHKGGTFCSAVFKNDNLQKATAIDSFVEFTEGSPMVELLNNVGQFKPQGTQFKLISKDCWTLTKEDLPKGIDFYFYDGSHSRESQRQAVTHFIDSMADEFIFMVDDIHLDAHILPGTQEGIDLATFRHKMKKSELPGFKVLYHQELWDGQPGNNFGFWNGVILYLCSKE